MDFHFDVHHSFKELYEAINPADLPFNHEPDYNDGAGEATTFIALPVKRNARKIGNQAKKSLIATLKLAVTNPNLIDEQDQYTYLDYEKALMPYILSTTADDSAKTLKILLEHEEKLKLDDYYVDSINATIQHTKEELKNRTYDNHLVLSNIPQKTQWYSLNQLRVHAGSPERSASGINRLANYYAQLQHLEHKFSFETGKVNIGFVWYESWHPSDQVATNCIQYEKAATLYNIAAVYSQLAAKERLSSPDGKKRALANFQRAAGILTYIRDSLTQRFKVNLESYADLHETSLSAMITLMLAQAAECFYEKATDEKKMSAVTAVIAVYVSDLYDVANRYTTDHCSMAKLKFPKYTTLHLKTKFNLYGAIAHFHTAPSTSNDRAVAERLTRLSIAKKLVTASLGYAQEIGGYLQDLVTGYAKNLATAHLCLDSANHEVIHHTPFDHRLLAPLRRPTDALVNPIDASDIMTMITFFPDVLEGVMSNTNHMALQEVLEHSRKLGTEGQAIVQGLLKQFAVEVKLGPMPNDVFDEKKFDKLKEDSKKLVEEIHKLQEDENILSTRDLLLAMSKVESYIQCNLDACTEVLGNLISEKSRNKDEAAAIITLRSMLSNIKEQQAEHTEHLNMIEKYRIKFNDEISAYDSTEWTRSKLGAIVPVLEESGKSAFGDIKTLWDGISTLIDKEKEVLKSLLTRAEGLLPKLKSLPFDGWTKQKSVTITEAIKARNDYIKGIEVELHDTSKQLEVCVKRIAGQKESILAIHLKLTELGNQAKIVADFHDSTAKGFAFKQELIKDVQKLLHDRKKSCRTLFLCLELKQEDDPAFLLRGRDTPKDPYVLKLIKSESDGRAENYKPTEHTDTRTLKECLIEDLILPLEKMVHHQDTFVNFWKGIHEIVEPPVEVPTLARKPSLLRVPSFRQAPSLLHVPSFKRSPSLSRLPSATDNYYIPRNAINVDELDAFYNQQFRFPHQTNPRLAKALHRRASSVTFEEDRIKPRTSVYDMLVNAKEGFLKLLGKNSNAAPDGKLKNNRRFSNASAHEMQNTKRNLNNPRIEISDVDLTGEEEQLDANISAIMKENAKLRAEVLKVRTERNLQKNQKLVQMQENLKKLRKEHHSEKKLPERKKSNNSELHKWVEEQNKLVQEPSSTDPNSESTSSSGTSTRLALAAVLTSTYDAVRKLRRKSANGKAGRSKTNENFELKNKKSKEIRSMVFADEQFLTERDLKQLKKTFDFTRLDSGISKSRDDLNIQDLTIEELNTLKKLRKGNAKITLKTRWTLSKLKTKML
ncbi:bck1-like resistance to osmotic shock [Terramyces sp. JEL0728]|nr:bck1-like resistance to osmotic shock [Terramyces sp. JEL0728]